MAKYAIHLHYLLTKLIFKVCHNGSWESCILHFKLLPEEWDILIQLKLILSVCTNLLHYVCAALMSAYSVRTFSKWLSECTYMHPPSPQCHICDWSIGRNAPHHIEDITLKPAVCIAASFGRLVLNWYYSKTNESIIYHCAISKSLVSPISAVDNLWCTLPCSSAPTPQSCILQACTLASRVKWYCPRPATWEVEAL